MLGPVTFIPVILEDAGLLPSLIRPSHIDSYAPGASLTCRLPASPMILGIGGVSVRCCRLDHAAQWSLHPTTGLTLI